MATPNHYHTLDVSPSATQTEIKQAYRRLAKLFHPDSNAKTASHDQIASVNAAYEVLGDPERRRHYDQQRSHHIHLEAAGFSTRGQARKRDSTAAAQAHYRQQQQTTQQADQYSLQWRQRVYTPVNRLISQILKPLSSQINSLSADPFDDELMQEFQDYLEDCRDLLSRAETLFQSLPNPPTSAKVAASLYFCLSQIEDGVEQLEQFTYSYDDYYIHTGQELFRIAAGLRREAQAALRDL